MWSVVPEDYYVYAIICLVIISLVLIKAAKYMSRTLPTMTRKRKKQLLEQQDFVATIVKKKKVFVYQNDFHYYLFWIKQSTLNICRFEYKFSLFIAWLIQAVSGRNSVGAWHVKEVISREKDNRDLRYEWTHSRWMMNITPST